MGQCEVSSWVLCIKRDFVYIQHYQNGDQESGKTWLPVWTCVFIQRRSLLCKFIFGIFGNILVTWNQLWRVVMSKEADLLRIKTPSKYPHSLVSLFLTTPFDNVHVYSQNIPMTMYGYIQKWQCTCILKNDCICTIFNACTLLVK